MVFGGREVLGEEEVEEEVEVEIKIEEKVEVEANFPIILTASFITIVL